MEVKEGFKHTEVGVIPEDWDVYAMGAIGNALIGLTYSPTDVKEFGTLVLRASNIQNGRLAFDDNVFVKMKLPDRAVTRINDILICVRNGSRRLIGKCALVDERTAGSAFGAFMSVFRAENGKFILFQFQSEIIKRQINEVLGATINQITSKDLARFKVILPPTKAEQEAIATVLSDTDALIATLEQLIIKKRHIKQGAMQDLLTGRRRLPGFEQHPGYKRTEVGVIPEDWEVKMLPAVCRFRGGKAHEQFVSKLGLYVIVNSKFISSDGKVRKYCTKNFCGANKDDILMVMSDLPNGRALAKAYLVEQGNLYAVNQRVCALTSYRDYPQYLFYILNRNSYFLKFDDGVNQTHLLNNVFAACPVLLPPTKAEQEAIATFLSDMDIEIATLEAKLTKTRQLRQGMMHELLTGKIRLV